MANFTENNLLYHIFSKSPVSDATTLAQSLNKSGHTLTTDDIFGEELPAFYDVANTTERNDLTAYNNDVCKIGNNFYYYTLKEDGSYGWLDRSAIADGECLFNRSSEYTNNGTDWKNHADEAVVKYHENKDGEFITKDNNGVNGNKFTVRVKKSDGNYIKQFISVTDKIVNSRTSNGYAPLVLQSGSVMEENAKYKDASSDNQRYIANCYAGIIQFPVQKSGTTVASNIKISVWEYIGKTLTDVLKGFATIDSGFNYRVAASYPAPSSDLKGWVYLIPSTSAKDGNVHDEFICVEDDKGGWKWEQIGSTAITIPEPPAAGDFLKLENDTYSVKTNDEIEDESGLPESDRTVPTTQAVYNYINNQESHEQWHEDNGLHHIELYEPQSGGSKSNQFSTGATCSGFIFNSPYLIKLSYFRIYGHLKSVFPPSGGSNFDFYVKIIDPKSGHILAVSEKAQVHGKNNNIDCDANVYFTDEPLLPKDTDFKVIFSSNNDPKDDTNDRTFQIAFGVKSDYIYSDGKTILGDNNEQGYFTKQYFTEPHGELKTPPSIITIRAGLESYDVNCIGVHVVPFGKFNKTDEFNDIAHESLKIYQHTNEQNKDVSDHIKNTDIHFSKSLILDKYYQDAGVKDLTQMGTSTADVQGIAYTQICADTYAFAKNSYLTSVKVPQNYSGTDYTNDNVYLVIYGDTTANGDGDWVFVASSKNSQLQKAGGSDMIFEFESGIDLGDYKRCRFFYSLTNEGEIPLPTTGANYTGVKMAFKAMVIDANCWIKQTNSTGSVIYNRAFPAIISYATEESILHKDNDERHITPEERERWNNNTSSSSNISISKNQATTLANQKSVYGHIANDGVLSLGVVSANNNTMGVSKLFTNNLSSTSSSTDATDTAVSVKSVQAMYSALASLISNITTNSLPTYNAKIEELEGVIKSNNETITNLTNQITILQNNIVILDNINNGSYDVSRANQNTAPDGSQWNEKVHDANNLKINYITHDDTNDLGMMYGTIGDN